MDSLDSLKPPHEAGIENSLQGDLARLDEMYQAGFLIFDEYFNKVTQALSAEQIAWDAACKLNLIPEQAETLFGRFFSDQPTSR